MGSSSARHGIRGALLVLLVACARERPPVSPEGHEASSVRPEAAEGQGRGSDAGSGAATGGSDAAGQAELAQRHGGKPALSSFRGEASYYGAAFDGRKTASGERFSAQGFTAAHRTLPFGTVVRVERVDTGKSVYVRITDRGPFGSRRRVIDLSQGAAEVLGMIRRGVAEVRVDVLELGAKRARRKR